ncbi:MAG: heparinase, partial [Pseudomonadota bacterium]
MAGLKVADRARIAGLFADGAKRTAVANALASPLLRWRYSSAATGEILIVPQDLRLSDPSFLGEIELGEYGLAGRHASAGDRSPFDIAPPSPQWQHELHGFSWLRHLDADDTPAASEMARKLVMDWMDRHAAGVNSADTPDVSARRIISWISNAHVILDNASDAQYERFIHSFARQLPHIAARWRNAAAGLPRLTCVISLCMGNLALGGYDRQLPEAIKRLED